MPPSMMVGFGPVRTAAMSHEQAVGKEEEADMAENKDRHPRKVHCSSSIGVVRKTFEEVLEVLSEWHDKGYRLRSVEWHSDTQRYTIHGSRDEWVYE